MSNLKLFAIQLLAVLIALAVSFPMWVAFVALCVRVAVWWGWL